MIPKSRILQINPNNSQQERGNLPFSFVDTYLIGTKSREVAQCVENFSELKLAGPKSRGTKSRGN